MILNINTTAIVKFTNILEKLRKSALPVAARGTLNDAVFDVKTRTMPQSASKEFTQRQKNFFTANSKFEAAKGLDMAKMQATVGFYDNKLREKSTNFAVKDLEQQEHGGKIDSKSFIPTVLARRGNTNRGLVRPNARIKAIRKKGIVESKKMRGQYHKLTKNQQLIVAAKKAGPGGFVLHEGLLLEVKGVMGKSVDAKPLYSVKRNRSVGVKRTEFMKQASLESGGRMNEFFVRQAQRQVKKYYGRL